MKKNPYLRNDQELPMENPLFELNEEQIMKVHGAGEGDWYNNPNGSAWNPLNWSAKAGNKGKVCTASVECQKGCS